MSWFDRILFLIGYWVGILAELIFAYKSVPIIAPYMVISIILLSVYIAYLCVETDE